MNSANYNDKLTITFTNFNEAVKFYFSGKLFGEYCSLLLMTFC